ncbi:DUF6777 domain-containing protein [Pseudonocardia sichuanensis]
MAAQVQLEPVSTAGTSPFMTPVGADQAGITPPAGTGGEFTGDTQGLYGETGDEPSCDSPSLLANLQTDPTKAAAWAEAVGIATADIPGYVHSLNPVVLRSDTAVTSYGYEDGTFFAYPAVLQAGTSVFVNGYGEPRVKCFSGNPLSEAQSYPQAGHAGPAWGHFQPATVTYVRPASTVVQNYTVVNVKNGGSGHRPGKHWPGEEGGYCTRHPDSDKCNGGKPTGPTPAEIKEQEKLDKAAADARQLAEQARKGATEARAKADRLNQEAGQAQLEMEKAKGAFDDKEKMHEALANALLPAELAVYEAIKAYEKNPTPENLAAREQAKRTYNQLTDAYSKVAAETAQAKKDFEAAEATAREKADQAKYAGSAATSAEGGAAHAEEVAKKSEEAAEQGPVKKPKPRDGNEVGNGDKVGEVGANPQGETPQDGDKPVEAPMPPAEAEPGGGARPGEPEQQLGPDNGVPLEQPSACPDAARPEQPGCENPPEPATEAEPEEPAPDNGAIEAEPEQSAPGAGQSPQGADGSDQQPPEGPSPQDENTEQPDTDGQPGEGG